MDSEQEQKNSGRQVDNLSINMQNTPTYYVKYRKEENEDKAIRELIKNKSVAEVIAKEQEK